MNIAERGEYWARWRPDDLALKVDDREITWGEWGERVPRIAGSLAAKGIEPGDRVGILAANCAEWCEVALAAFHAGGIVVPLNIRLAAPELAYVIEHSGCKAVAYDGTFAELYGKAAEGKPPLLRISLDGAADADTTHAELADGTDAPVSVERSDSDPAVIGYTSGTTGFPKGATLTHANIAAVAQQYVLAEGSTHARRALLPVPLAFTGGIVNNFLLTYMAGGALILEKEFVPNRILQLLVDERITYFMGVPIMWQGVMAAEGFAEADLSALDTAVCGGARVPKTMMEAYLAKDVVIRQAYALTEATGSACILPKRYAAEKTAAAGVPNADTRIRLVAEDGTDITEAGVVGEIVLKGPQVMARYWEDEEATAAALKDGWLFTGDMGQFDEDGFLEVVDRLKAMFISGGINVYPAEIERVVDQRPDVAECVALGIDHERFGEACAMVIVPAGEGEFDEEDFLAYCREHMADYKVPRTIFVAREPLPRGMSGKILRPDVQEKYGGGVPA